MLGKLLRLTLAVALFAGPALADPADTVAVYTPVRPVTDTYHGVSVSDPYRWLEDGKDQQVVDWTAAENARTRATLDALKTREPIKRELTRLIGASSPSWSDLQARGSYVFALYNDPARQQPSLVTLNAAADPASRRTLLDPNLIDPTGLTAIDWFVASPDGRYVAVSLSKGGSEDGTLHIYVAATGAEAGEPIPRVQYPTGGGSLAWTRDGAASGTPAIRAKRRRQPSVISTCRSISTCWAPIGGATPWPSALATGWNGSLRCSSTTAMPKARPWPRCSAAMAASGRTMCCGPASRRCRSRLTPTA